jgi:hypothetical protein
VLYRVSAVLLVLFALGHQIGFRQVDPSWNADAVAGAMQSVRFEVQGFDRTYWEFFSGFGFFVTTLLVFSAVLAFELSRLPAQVFAGILTCPLGIRAMLSGDRGTDVGVFLPRAGYLCDGRRFMSRTRGGCAAKGGEAMTTRETIQAYFERLARKDGWEASLADDMTFTSFTSPARQPSRQGGVSGRHQAVLLDDRRRRAALAHCRG